MKSTQNRFAISLLAWISLCVLACDSASGPTQKNQVKAAKGPLTNEIVAELGAEKSIAKVRAELAKHYTIHLDGIEAKIEKLGSDASAEIQTRFNELRDKVETLKKVTPEKYAELKSEIETKLSELKALVDQ